MKKSIITAAAIVFAGAMLPVSVSRLKSYDRTVDVKGLCEKEVRADKVIWPLTYKVVGNDLNAALGEIESDNAVVMSFLRDGGIGDADITVKAPEISDLMKKGVALTANDWQNQTHGFCRYLSVFQLLGLRMHLCPAARCIRL